MHLSLCTISFRHHLTSLPELADFAHKNGLDGIELWAPHAKNLPDHLGFNTAWLSSLGIDISMLSGYLPTTGPREAGRREVRTLCSLARQWQTTKLRTFAGTSASACTNSAERDGLVYRLREYCREAEQSGLELLIETHPNTYADCTTSTLELLERVDHPALKVNLDVLHLWEAKEDPSVAWRRLAPYVRHMHFKNISSEQHLEVFAPANVYSAAGSREGMVPLFRGACDYTAFLRALPQDRTHCVSLEWFGDRAASTIAQDARELRGGMWKAAQAG